MKNKKFNCNWKDKSHYQLLNVSNSSACNSSLEWSGQCIHTARVPLANFDNPVGKAKRWDGSGFNAPADNVGKLNASLRIPHGKVPACFLLAQNISGDLLFGTLT